MKRFLMFLTVLAGVSMYAEAMTPTPIIGPTAVIASSTGISGAGVTVTISSPVATVYSTGLFTYLTHLRIEMYAVGALTGGATPVTCTTTNIPSNPTFKFPTAAAIGTVSVTSMNLDTPVATTSSAANTTIVCPSTTNVIWNVITSYYIAQ